MQLKDVIYRAAVPEDADAIVEFQVNMALETESIALDGTICNAGVQAVFDDPSRGRYFVAERNDRIVASLLITYEWSDWRCRQVWWIQSVYVAAGERRRGIYSGLYAHVQAIAESDPGIAGIRLYVDRRNTRAQQVYARLGMDGEHYQVFEWMKGS
jgi:GNAT superfamily N-acetyltransferase